MESELFHERFLLTRPLLEAIRSEEPVVLLVDEVDRLDIETEALLLEVLSEYQVSIPELGTLRARTTPLVFLTSNNSRELSEALKHRCLYLHIGYPTAEHERDIVLAQVPGIEAVLMRQGRPTGAVAALAGTAEEAVRGEDPGLGAHPRPARRRRRHDRTARRHPSGTPQERERHRSRPEGVRRVTPRPTGSVPVEEAEYGVDASDVTRNREVVDTLQDDPRAAW